MSSAYKTCHFENVPILETTHIPQIERQLCQNVEQVKQCVEEGIPMEISLQSLDMKNIGKNGAND